MAAWEAMLKPPVVLDEAAIFKANARYHSHLNLFGISRRLLMELEIWRQKNGGLLTYDEVLLGSLALQQGLSCSCFQHW